MLKSTKIFIALIIASVVICGIGTGVGFAEYNNLEYGGTKVISPEGQQKQTFTYTISDDADVVDISGLAWMNDEEYFDVTYSSTLPANTLKVYVTSAKDNVASLSLANNRERMESDDVYFYYDDDELHFHKENVVIDSLWLDYSGDSEMYSFMTAKDQIIEDLKNDQIYSYEVESGVTVTKVVASENLRGCIANERW